MQRPPYLIVTFCLCVVFTTAIHAQQATNSEVTELFKVSKVGVPNAAESRDLLMSLYGSIKEDHDAKVKQQEANAQVAYKGTRVRVIKKLNESDANGQFYLVAYEGGPCVASIASNQSFRAGMLTPALVIRPDGEHVTTYNRRIAKKTTGKPRLSTVNKSGGATFFGIPIGGGGGSTQEEAETVTYKTVTEKKTLRKYSATVSTERTTAAPPMFSKELFLGSIKNGQYYTVNRTETRNCRDCGGFGKVTAKGPGKRPQSGKVNCPDCKGRGKITWDVTYQVAW